MAKKQQTKTTKHTIEFSNNTPEPTAQKPRGQKPPNLLQAVRRPTEMGNSLGIRLRSPALVRVALTWNKLRQG
jgi:hypothetical protein